MRGLRCEYIELRELLIDVKALQIGNEKSI